MCADEEKRPVPEEGDGDMTLLILLYIFFHIGGFWILRASPSQKKEMGLFFGLTTLGAVLWGSIILRHPLDVNKAIGWMLSHWL